MLVASGYVLATVARSAGVENTLPTPSTSHLSLIVFIGLVQVEGLDAGSEVGQQTGRSQTKGAPDAVVRKVFGGFRDD